MNRIFASQILGEKDTDGFYWGENSQGQCGYVPCNMVSEVQVDDERFMQDNFSNSMHRGVCSSDVLLR